MKLLVLNEISLIEKKAAFALDEEIFFVLDIY